MAEIKGPILCILLLSFTSCTLNNLPPSPISPDEDNPNTLNIPNDTLDLVAGRSHTCMLYRGNVRCWGKKEYNGYNVSLGKRRTTREFNKHLEFTGITSNVSEIAAGLLFTCVLFENGEVRCWGDNSSGQLGRGNTTNIVKSSDAVSINFGMGVFIKHIAAGDDHACAIDTVGQIHCWGSGAHGKLGNMATTNIGHDDMTATIGVIAPAGPMPPMNLTPPGRPVKLALGSLHSCALYQDGTTLTGIFCWGNPAQFGINQPAPDPIVPSSSRLLVADFPPDTVFTDIVANAGTTCLTTTTTATATTKRAYCWGIGAAGQLGYGCGAGDGEENIRVHGVGNQAMAMPPMGMNRVANDLFMGMVDTVLVPEGGAMDARCRSAGNITSYQNYTDIRQVAVGPLATYSCVVHDNNSVHCFGINLGIQSLSPGEDVMVNLSTSVSCTAPSTGTNFIGGSPLGYGVPTTSIDSTGMTTVTTITALIPTRIEPVPVGSPVIRLVAGEAHVCAILTSRDIVCWGVNCDGQLGYGSAMNEDHTGGEGRTPNTYGSVPFPFGDVQ